MNSNKTGALIVTAFVGLCLLAVVVAVAILLVEQHAVPYVAVGLITTLAALIVPSPLGPHTSSLGGIESAVSGLLSHTNVTATTTTPVAASGPAVDLTAPAVTPTSEVTAAPGGTVNLTQ